MRRFINTLDEKAWKSMFAGWSPPTTMDDEGKIVPKPELDWSSKVDKLENHNRKALNAILNGLDLNQLKLIFTMESTKEAWDILQVMYEGTNTVRESRLQLLTTNFENLCMQEDKTIGEYNSRVCNIENEAFSLGEKIPEERLVRKVLRSLPKRFAYKVTAINKAKNIKTMKLEELVGSLRTFKMYIEDEKGTTSSHYNLALNTKYDASRMDRNRGINCRECGGCDHVQEECSNILSYATTWSDDDSENNKDGKDIFSESVALVSHSTKTPPQN